MAPMPSRKPHNHFDNTERVAKEASRTESMPSGGVTPLNPENGEGLLCHG
jgi:hypothetical protein